MSHKRESLKPIQGARRSLRRRLDVRGELVLALLPTVIMLTVLAMVEVLSRQRLLFASLASSAFLIYLDPQHGTNSIRTLFISQMMAATVGLVMYLILGPGYVSGGSAMVITIVLMILLDVVHPPAVSTSLSFAFRAGNETNWVLFGLAVAITALLVIMERLMLWFLANYRAR
jgi:CBS-domain-containing membrane protein